MNARAKPAILISNLDTLAFEAADTPMWVYDVKSLAFLAVNAAAILHYGYASPADRARRYKRYTSLADHGHAPEFIESIVDGTERWVPRVWAGEVPCDVR